MPGRRDNARAPGRPAGGTFQIPGIARDRDLAVILGQGVECQAEFRRARAAERYEARVKEVFDRGISGLQDRAARQARSGILRSPDQP